MMAQKVRNKQTTKTNTASKQSISLKGSTRTVTEFFEFGLSSILYQRGIYPADDFKMVKKYGLNMLLPNDEGLQTYLRSITDQLSTWLNNRQVSRLVLAIISKESRETLERWQFDITLEEGHRPQDMMEQQQQSSSELLTDSAAPEQSTSATSTSDDGPATGAGKKKKELSEEDVRNQIQQMIKHICASNAFLPILDQSCTFNVLAYTDKDVQVPAAWEDSDARMIQGGSVEQVKLRGFSTNVHKVDALVAYRLGEDSV